MWFASFDISHSKSCFHTVQFDQLRIQSTPHWCQTCFLFQPLLATWPKALWWSLGIAKAWWMTGQSSRSKSKNFKKVKDLHLLLEIHPWSLICYRRSTKIAWLRRPAKWVLWTTCRDGRSAFDAHEDVAECLDCLTYLSLEYRVLECVKEYKYKDIQRNNYIVYNIFVYDIL